eukprot:TRINITY_DN45449_c0_g1_i1.p1 TRINITY_DN45449_c0_g1~~TRINITY_DN45449_c0_g1_i1.p1  ORF type:complete len:473 (-),score=103.52 TRINITY_DN45449_c0_g1_i1:218-1636(-)
MSRPMWSYALAAALGVSVGDGATFVPTAKASTDAEQASAVKPLVRRAVTSVNAMALVDNSEAASGSKLTGRSQHAAIAADGDAAVMDTDESAAERGSIDISSDSEATLEVHNGLESRSEYVLRSNGKRVRTVSVAADSSGLGLFCEEDYQSGYSRPGSPKLSHIHVGMVKPGGADPEKADAMAADFGDRLVRAATVTDAMHSCQSFFSFGDYTWCDKAMPAETLYAEWNPWSGKRCNVTGSSQSLLEGMNKQREANHGQFEGLSFGIEELDVWSELMSNMFFVKSRLYDCYINPPNGPMYNDWHGSHSTEKQCKDQRCYSIGYEINKECLDTEQYVKEKRTYKSLHDYLQGAGNLSKFVKMDVEGSEWGVLSDLLKNEEDMAKIRSLDMEVHMGAMNHGFTMDQKVGIMEDLAKKFAVTGSTIQLQGEAETDEFNRQREKDPQFLRRWDMPHSSSGIPLAAYCISFVNRALL